MKFQRADTRRLTLWDVCPETTGYCLINPEFAGMTWFPPQASGLPVCSRVRAALLSDGVPPRFLRPRPRQFPGSVACCTSDGGAVRTHSYAHNGEHPVVAAIPLPGMSLSGLTPPPIGSRWLPEREYARLGSYSIRGNLDFRAPQINFLAQQPVSIYAHDPLGHTQRFAGAGFPTVSRPTINCRPTASRFQAQIQTAKEP